MDYSLSFDDVLLVPKFSNVASRKDVNVNTKLCSQTFFPVISANMDTITGPEMVNAISDFGGRGCLHRFCSIEDNVTMYKNATYGNASPWVSFGLGEVELNRAQALKDVGASVFILDVAHGANVEVAKQVKAFREALHFVPSLIVGNFSTAESIIAFQEALKDEKGHDGNFLVNGYKVGIGGGSACTTRVVTGCGMPTLASLLDCSKANVSLIADGGMRTSGDVAKALAIPGVRAVMLGGMLAGTVETPGAVIGTNGEYYKKYRGSASKESYSVQGKDSSWRTAEGESFLVPHKGSVKDVLQNIDAGLRSAFSYVGANNLKEFQEKATFIKVTQNGYIEGTPHGRGK